METIILQFLENIRCGFLTAFSFLFSLFGETLFLIVLICSIYWLVDKKFGERLVVQTFSSMAVNSLLKNVIARPRPYTAGVVSRVEIDTPLLSTMNLAANASFPSGHSQMSAGMFFTVAFRFKKTWAWIIFPLLTLCVMFSRMYFGVHYPTDTLIGCLLGVSFACFWHFIYERHEDKKYIALTVFAVLSIPVAFLFPSKSLWEMSASLCALAIALPIENIYIRYDIQQGAGKKALRALIGFAIVGAIYAGFSLLPVQTYLIKFIKYFCLILSAALLVPFLFKKLKI